MASKKQEKVFTVWMPPDLHKRMQAFCVDNGMKLKFFIAQAVEEKLERGKNGNHF